MYVGADKRQGLHGQRWIWCLAVALDTGLELLGLELCLQQVSMELGLSCMDLLCVDLLCVDLLCVKPRLDLLGHRRELLSTEHA